MSIVVQTYYTMQKVHTWMHKNMMFAYKSIFLFFYLARATKTFPFTPKMKELK